MTGNVINVRSIKIMNNSFKFTGILEASNKAPTSDK